ncbi:MAG: signal peptidase II [Desulfobacterium sp.]|jgi:signal peptidase II|nr:signal peptidase II [Desulfobacterium sp.]
MKISSAGKGSLKRLGVISAVIVVLDQVSKAIVLTNLALHESIPVINGFFNLTHIMNPGGAFGLFAEHSPEIRKFFFLFVSSLVALMILWLYRKVARTHRLLSFGLAGIFAGAVGNLIDRFRFGKVVDFLDFYLGAYHWPAFNVADSAITLGMVVFVYHVALNKIPDF